MSHVDGKVGRTLVRIGVVAGVMLGVMYPARTFLPLPDPLGLVFFIYFGPLITVAVIGFYPFLTKPGPSGSAILGTVFGILGGIANMMFAVVQMNNLFYIRRYMGAAESEAARDVWQNILNGVFTVQNGLNFVADFFIDWTALLFAIVMWSHPKFGKLFALTGFVAGGLHFGMKLYTFPEPPAEAALFDAGPLVSVWFAIVTIQIIRHISWMDE